MLAFAGGTHPLTDTQQTVQLMRTFAKLLSVAALVGGVLCTTPREASAIQVLENVTEVNGVVVADTLTIGITASQLLLGPIQGFLVNLILFPFVGPQPEITLFEIDLLGAGVIAPDDKSAQWVFSQPIISPTTVTANLDIDFRTFFPTGAEAIYDLSSLDEALHPIETVPFDVPAPVPEPPMTGSLLCLLVAGGAARMWRRRSVPVGLIGQAEGAGWDQHRRGRMTARITASPWVVLAAAASVMIFRPTPANADLVLNRCAHVAILEHFFGVIDCTVQNTGDEDVNVKDSSVIAIPIGPDLSDQIIGIIGVGDQFPEIPAGDNHTFQYVLLTPPEFDGPTDVGENLVEPVYSARDADGAFVPGSYTGGVATVADDPSAVIPPPPAPSHIRHTVV